MHRSRASPHAHPFAPGCRTSSAVFAGQLTAKLDAIPGLPRALADAVRESISAVGALPPGLREPVAVAYADAARSVFLLVVGGAGMCVLSALLIERKRVAVKPGGMVA